MPRRRRVRVVDERHYVEFWQLLSNNPPTVAVHLGGALIPIEYFLETVTWCLLPGFGQGMVRVQPPRSLGTQSPVGGEAVWRRGPRLRVMWSPYDPFHIWTPSQTPGEIEKIRATREVLEALLAIENVGSAF